MTADSVAMALNMSVWLPSSSALVVQYSTTGFQLKKTIRVNWLEIGSGLTQAFAKTMRKLLKTLKHKNFHKILSRMIEGI